MRTTATHVAWSVCEWVCCMSLLVTTVSSTETAEPIDRSVSADNWSVLPQQHTRLTALFPGLPGWAGTRKVKPIWILLKQETVSGSGISWAVCKSAPRSRQITTPAPHHSVFYRPDALPLYHQNHKKGRNFGIINNHRSGTVK